jgi:hypothetical protein
MGGCMLNYADVQHLALWIDSTYNTKTGFDESLPCVAPIFQHPTAVGTYFNPNPFYQSKTSGSWDGKFLNLGDNGAFRIYTQFYNNPMSIEFVYKVITPPPSDKVFRLMSTSSLGVYIGWISETLCFATNIDSNVIIHEVEEGKSYYDVFTYNGSTRSIKVHTPSEDKLYETTGSLNTVSNGSNVRMGFGTGHVAPSYQNTFNSSNTYTKGFGFGMVRCWTKELSSEEIQANWQEIQKRFEF